MRLLPQLRSRRSRTKGSTRLRLLPRSTERQEADANARRDHRAGQGDETEGHGGAAAASGKALQPDAEARSGSEDVARQAAAGRPDRAAGRRHDLGELAQMTPEQIKKEGVFPYPPLPHPKQATGGQVFPADADRDVSAAAALRRGFRSARSVPARISARHLSAKPAGTGRRLARRGRFDQQLLRAFQRHSYAGATRWLRMLLTPLPQEEFNPTDDRKTEQPSLGVTCLDCHVNGHTTGQFHLNPDDRPQQRRFRLDTVSLRGVFNQQIHGSKRSLRSVEDFTEFEQRTAYFNGDQIHAFKKGAMILDRVQVSHMAQMQNMFDFPPAPKLDPVTGRLDPAKATESEMRGEKLFFGKAQCASCHPGTESIWTQIARSAPGALPERAGRWADQDLHAARHQGQPALPARRPLPDAGRHGRVLQSGARAEAFQHRRRPTSSRLCGRFEPSFRARAAVWPSGFADRRPRLPTCDQR